MPDWDADSPELLHNLLELSPLVAADAAARQPLFSETVRGWHTRIMHGLRPIDGEPSGIYRGEPGLDDYEVAVGHYRATAAHDVATALADFDRLLAEQIEVLDHLIRRDHFDEDHTADSVMAVLVLCAWAHGEWVRIHPFPNGNGRTARLLVNSVALRYGLPAFMRLRPRPGPAYETAAEQAMQGDWTAAIPLFVRLYDEYV